MLFNHIDELERTYTDLGEQINDPDIIANQEKWQKLMKEYSNMGPVVEKYREYKNALKSAEEAEEMLKESKDEEFRELLKEELTQSKEDAEKFREELKVLLLPKDPNDSKNVIMEIRAGTGGNEQWHSKNLPAGTSSCPQWSSCSHLWWRCFRSGCSHSIRKKTSGCGLSMRPSPPSAVCLPS